MGISKLIDRIIGSFENFARPAFCDITQVSPHTAKEDHDERTQSRLAEL